MSTTSTAPAPPRVYRYYELVMAAFVTILLCSDLIAPTKATELTLPFLGKVDFGAGVIFFPISYIFGDVLTEVYGYAKARRVIWSGFGALIFAAIMASIVVALPPAPGWSHQDAFETVFGNTWRIVLASMTAYFCGEFVNSYVLAKMKVWTNGKYLWARFVGSTIAGEAVDSSIFYPLAFFHSGLMPDALVFKLTIAQFVTKTLVEIVLLPVTYRVTAFLKKAEREDYYDRTTDFNPLHIT